MCKEEIYSYDSIAKLIRNVDIDSSGRAYLKRQNLCFAMLIAYLETLVNGYKMTIQLVHLHRDVDSRRYDATIFNLVAWPEIRYINTIFRNTKLEMRSEEMKPSRLIV